LLFLQVLRSFSFLSFVGELKNRYLYLLCRLSIYVAVIGTSYHPIEEFFATLDIFTAAILKSLSATIAVAVDVVAMDLFARSVLKVVHKAYFGAVSLAIPALIIVCGNIYITQKFMSSSLRTAELETRNGEWSAEISELKAKVSKKEQEFSEKKAIFMGLKWRGAMAPEKCEMREIKCNGPFTTLAQPAQIGYLAAESALNLAKEALENTKQETPKEVTIESDGLKTKVLIYSVFWIVILLTFIYDPRKA
jgi:hypothetical protein